VSVRRGGIGRSLSNRHHDRRVEVRRPARTDQLSANKIAALVYIEVDDTVPVGALGVKLRAFAQMRFDESKGHRQVKRALS
jgi:hypothetical protein